MHAIVTEDARDVDDMVGRACQTTYQADFAKPDQRVIVVAGVPFGAPGATNMVRVAFIEG